MLLVRRKPLPLIIISAALSLAMRSAAEVTLSSLCLCDIHYNTRRRGNEKLVRSSWATVL